MDTSELTINDAESLALAGDFVRDGEFVDKDMVFDDKQRVFTITVWKHGSEPNTPRPNGPTSWYDLPLRCLEVQFDTVSTVSTSKENAGSGKHPIGGFRWGHHGVVSIDTYDGITVDLAVSKLIGKLRVTNKTR